MYGHKFIKINENFFRDGWVADSLGLSQNAQSYLVGSQDPYFVAKLASVEVFGRIYAMGNSIQQVSQHIESNAQVQLGEN